MEKFRITNRLQRIISLAQNHVIENNYKVLYPIDLFLAILQEKTGILGELYLKLEIDFTVLLKISAQLTRSDKANSHFLFNCKVSDKIVEILEKAESNMNKYGQIYLNEGHVIKALLSSENEVNYFIKDKERELILDITTTCRDLAVYLENYQEVNLKPTSFIVKRAEKSDQEVIYNFISTEFSLNWADNVKRGFDMEKIPIFIAVENNALVGFGAYDLLNKGLFGPMGTKKDNRTKLLGYYILHNCLKDMKDIGYKYAIIDEAGPIEFYEKSCGAVVIYK